jgi:hypothetical protein
VRTPDRSPAFFAEVLVRLRIELYAAAQRFTGEPLRDLKDLISEIATVLDVLAPVQKDEKTPGPARLRELLVEALEVWEHDEQILAGEYGYDPEPVERIAAIRKEIGL